MRLQVSTQSWTQRGCSRLLKGGLGELHGEIYVSENAFQTILKPFFHILLLQFLVRLDLKPQGGGGYFDIFIRT